VRAERGWIFTATNVQTLLAHLGGALDDLAEFTPRNSPHELHRLL